MAHAFQYKKTTKFPDGRKTFHYETDGGFHKMEIDELVNAEKKYMIALCSVGYYMDCVDTYADTRKTLLNRLEVLFD